MDPDKRKLYWERTVDFVHKRMMTFMPRDKRDALRSRKRREAFARIADEERWGESLSGGGSTLDYTVETRAVLLRVVEQLGITSMVDVACGDFQWMPLVLDELPRSFRYVGSDIVPKLIEQHRASHPDYEFRVADFVNDELPDCDLILCRDALQHLPVADIHRALANFSGSGAKYLLVTTHLRRYGWRNGRDKRVGQCSDRNLMLEPFNLSDPIAIYSERDPGHKFLGLWELPLTTANGDPIV